MLANITGALGIAANMAIYQQNNRKKLLVFKLISDALWALHYFFLSAYSGAAVGVIGIFREFDFYCQVKKQKKSNFKLVFFMLVSIISAILTWKSFYSILPATASVISVISFWNNKPALTRAFALPISGMMLTYDIICNSYMGIANEILTLISVISAIIMNLIHRDV